MDNDNTSIDTYRVWLKSGAYGDFPNTNGYEDYPARLMAGNYSVATGDTIETITVNSVAKIEKLSRQ